MLTTPCSAMISSQRRHWPSTCSSASSFACILLLSLLSILLPTPSLSQSECIRSPSDCPTCITFEQLNPSDSLPWTARAGATLLLLPQNYTYHNASNPWQLIHPPPNSLVMFGGDGYPDTPAIYNDVWLSADGGGEWELIAGNASSSGVWAGPSFVPVTSSVVAMGSVVVDPDSNSTVQIVMKIGGEPEDRHEESLVFVSADMSHWLDRIAQNLPRYQLSAAVINSTGNVLLLGGRTVPQQNSQSQPVADVWQSSDRGQSWDCLTTSAAFGPRFSHAAVRLTGKQTTGTGGADVVLVVGGTNGPTHFNDVWASSDAVTWKLLTGSAAFSPRRDFSLLATDDGILLITAGQDTASSFNDIFTSMNGGYTWYEYQWPHSAVSVSSSLTASRLTARTTSATNTRSSSVAYSPDQFSARHSHMAALDAHGCLYISGGLGTSRPRSAAQRYLTDLLKFSLSFSNASLVAAVFGAEVSRCGLGLYCYDDSTSVGAGGVVTCSGCSEDSVSLLTLCVVIGVVACCFVAFMVWRNCWVKAQHEKPVGVNEHLVNEDEVDE